MLCSSFKSVAYVGGKIRGVKPHCVWQSWSYGSITNTAVTGTLKKKRPIKAGIVRDERDRVMLGGWPVCTRGLSGCLLQ